MAATSPSAPVPLGGRPLTLIPGGRRPLDRDAALRRARDARRRLQPREERFAHLRRAYD